MKNNQDTAHTPHELLVELQALVTEAETLLADSGSEHSADALGSLRARFGAAREQFADLYEGARKKVAAGAKSTDKAIRENPYQALALALGVGVLVGVLVGRRGK
jgi:ElaB/YqjD/DUF883 family membrane-anchored ribosome-binding protein